MAHSFVASIFMLCCARCAGNVGLSENKVTHVFCNFSITDGKLLLIKWIPASNLPE